MSRRRASGRLRSLLAISAAAAAIPTAACGRKEAQVVQSFDLLAEFAFADVRANTVDLPFLFSRPLMRQRGWEEERTPEGALVVWTRGTAGSLVLPLSSTGDKELHLEARCREVHGPRLATTVTLNGHEVGVLQLTPTATSHRLALPAAAQVAGDNELRLDALVRVPRRHRAIALSRLEVAPVGQARPLVVPSRSPGGVWLPAASSVGYYLPREPRAELQIKARSRTAPGARLEVVLHNGTLSTPVVGMDLSADRTQVIRKELPTQTGEFLRLEIAAAGGAGLWIEELGLHARRAPRPAKAALPGRPNIIIFVADALRADYLGAYGHATPTSPHFDGFAREGVLFEDASAQSSWTRPAVASILTGLGVDAHGVDGVTNTMVPEITTLAETLRSGGYATGGFVANGIVNAQLGFAQGFESWDPLAFKPAADLVESALRWVEKQNRPLFAYVHMLEPHRPYDPAPEHWRPFLPAGYAGRRDVGVILQGPQPPPAELRYVQSAYEGEIRQGDAAFGALLSGLASRGLLERTIVVFTADHGEEFYDHGASGHGASLYREVLHIPMAMRIPGAKQRSLRDSTPVQQIDIAPTLLALAGLAAPAQMQGRDLSARCVGAASLPEEPTLLLSQLTFPEELAMRSGHAARFGHMKLIVVEEKRRPEVSHLELYDLRQDRGETQNLIDREPMAARFLRTRAAAVQASQAAVRTQLKAGRQVPMTDEQREQLRALGYIR